MGAVPDSGKILLTDWDCIGAGGVFRAIGVELGGEAGGAMDGLRRNGAAQIRLDQGSASSDALREVASPPMPGWSLIKAEQAAAVTPRASATQA